ncbi:hypothetical protein ACLQ26_20030 [Micromonospora sp. DT43]|uniref:hypothetical protein n=1 Tax=Micromonospora sp. DT43 TaxID=3393440 RepID=UPI003CFBBC96
MAAQPSCVRADSHSAAGTKQFSQPRRLASRLIEDNIYDTDHPERAAGGKEE